MSDQEKAFRRYGEAGQLTIYELERIVGKLESNGFKITKPKTSIMLLATCFQSLTTKVGGAMELSRADVSKELKEDGMKSVMSELDNIFILLYDLNNPVSIGEMQDKLKNYELLRLHSQEALLKDELMTLIKTITRI